MLAVASNRCLCLVASGFPNRSHRSRRSLAGRDGDVHLRPVGTLPRVFRLVLATDQEAVLVEAPRGVLVAEIGAHSAYQGIAVLAGFLHPATSFGAVASSTTTSLGGLVAPPGI
jgi:hypothetical protein